MSSQQKHCGNCGAALVPGDQFCGECGHPVPTEAAPPPPHQAPPPEKKEEGKPRSNILIRILSSIVLLSVVGVLARFVSQFLADRLARPISTSIPNVITVEPLATIAPVQDESTLIQGVFLEHDVQVDGQSYLGVHAQLQVSQADSDKVWVTAYFWRNDGSPMDGFLEEYTINGQAAVWELAEVTYSPVTYWEDFVLLIPVSGLEVGEDHYVSVVIEDEATTSVLYKEFSETFSVLP